LSSPSASTISTRRVVGAVEASSRMPAAMASFRAVPCAGAMSMRSSAVVSAAGSRVNGWTVSTVGPKLKTAASSVGPSRRT
jgi:hypothetical protein